ncbi:MAG: hypothetical protein EOO60_09550 [Hymenobacter sp.]|nr:MAG: hypothetical protein EOO60_09550 [Hymenobacter sp.]
MRKSSFLPAAFLLLAACAPASINSASYALKGQHFRVSARALSGMGTPSGRDGLDIEIGRRPFDTGEGVFLVSYEKPAEAPEAAYSLSLLTYTYHAADSYTSVSYTLDLRGKLTRRPGGGFSGRFYGTLPATTTGERSTVQGTFRVAAPARKAAVAPRGKQ